MFEGTPSPQERKDIHAAYESADPSKYSALPEKGKLRKTDRQPDSFYENRIHENADEQYVEVFQNPKLQQVISRLLKGILNVSEVVQHPDQDAVYLSRVLPTERIENKTPKGEMQADLIILEALFGDADHELKTLPILPLVSGTNFIRKKGRTAYYDFGAGSRMFSDVPEAAYEKIRHLNNPLAKQILLQKIRLLTEQFSGEAGKEFIASALGTSTVKELFLEQPENADASAFSDSAAFLQKELMGRLERLEKTAKEQ